MFFSMLMVSSVLQSSGVLNFKKIGVFGVLNYLDDLWIALFIFVILAFWLFFYLRMKYYESDVFGRYIEVWLPISIILLTMFFGQLHQRWLNEPNKDRWYNPVMKLMFKTSHQCIILWIIQEMDIRVSDDFSAIEMQCAYLLGQCVIFTGVVCLTYTTDCLRELYRA
jgi:hypothetical protein